MPGPASKKQSQRTKGNVRPSSSSQAAHLLSSSGAPSGFIGFGTSGGPAFVPASELFDDVDSSLDSDFRLVLTKFSKRDSTTKTKALREFIDLTKEKDGEILKSVLPFWPRIYNKLALDVDHKVREITQQALMALLQKVHRKMAPYLKNIIGCWLLSQCDTYPTVSSVAQQAFQEAFPAMKQTEAIEFCKMEIIEYLIDNLINQTSITLSDPKVTSAEDMENKYCRVVTSSFLALRILLVTLNADESNALDAKLIQLLDSPKFWKHSKTKNNLLKSGMYAFLASLCQTKKNIALSYSEKLSPLILHNIDTTETVILHSLWEAVLSLVSNVEDCWSRVNIPKAFWPKLRGVLEKGFSGNASVICPNMLPILSKIPADILGVDVCFYLQFFSYFKAGLSQDTVQNSSSECNAVVRSFMECMLYVCKQLLKEDDQLNVVKELLHDHVLPLSEASIIEAKPALSKSDLYYMLGTTLSSLEQLTEDKASAQEIILSFWDALSISLSDILTNLTDDASQNYVVDRIILMCQSFIYQQDQTKKKTEVRFASSLKDSPTCTIHPEMKKKLSKFQKNFLEKRTQEAFQLADANKLSVFVKLFSQLLILDLSAETVSKIVKCHEDNISEYLVVKHFICSVCIPWIGERQGSVDETLHLLDVMLAFLPLLEKEDSVSVLASLFNVITLPSVLFNFLSKAFSKRDSCEAVSVWMESSQFGDKLVYLTDDVCQKSLTSSAELELDLHDSWSVLSLSMSFMDDKGLVLNSDTVQKLLQKIHGFLLSFTESSSVNKIDVPLQLVADLIFSFYTQIKGSLPPPVGEDILLTLLKMSLSSDDLTECTRQSIQSAWTTGLRSLIRYTGGYLQEDRFVLRACSYIQDLVNSKTETFSQFSSTVETTELFLSTVLEELPEKSVTNPVMIQIIDNITFSIEHHVPKKAFEHAGLVDQLLITEYPMNKTTPSFPQNLYITMHNLNLIHFKLFGQFTQSKTPDDSNIEEEMTDKIKQQLTSDLQSSDISTIQNVLLGYTACKLWQSLDTHLVSKFGDLLSALDQLEKHVIAFIKMLSVEQQRNLVRAVLKSSEENGLLQAMCLSAVMDILHEDGNIKLDGTSMIDRYLVSGITENMIQTLQQAVPYFSPTECENLMEILAAQLVSCTAENATVLNGGLGTLAVFRKIIAKLKGSGIELKEVVKSGLCQISQWKEESENLLLFDCDLTEASTAVVLLNVEVIRYLQLVVDTIPCDLSNTDWDFIMCSLVGWNQTINSGEELVKNSFQCFCLAVCVQKLTASVAMCLSERVSQNPSLFPNNLLSEWEEFFSEAIYSFLLPHFYTVAEKWKDKHLNGSEQEYLRSLGDAVSRCPKAQIKSHKLEPYFIAGESSSLPDCYQTLLNRLCPLLVSSNQSISLTVFHILNSVIPEFPQFDKELLADQAGSEAVAKETASRSLPVSMASVLESTTSAVDIVLAEANVDECFKVQPDTEEYQYTLGYLLLWQLIIAFFKGSSAEMRAEYASYLQDKDAVKHLIRSLFCLMPQNPVRTEGKSPINMFETLPNIKPTEYPHRKTIQHVSCNLFKNCLETIPALVRQWWNDQDRKTSAYVDKFTSKNVSQLLCCTELQDVQKSNVEIENFTVKARTSTREVVAIYQVEEITMEMVISLPQNYPLGRIEIHTEKRMGATKEQWKKWLLQLNIYLQHQNGSIIDGLRLWKKNIDKRFDGVEDCMICFSVIHGTTYQLPKLQCRTCKKKFHSACLYKWFNTSNNSTCPLCRNLF